MDDLRAARSDTVETEGTVGGVTAADGERLRQTVSGDTVCSARNTASSLVNPSATGHGGGSGQSLRSALLATVVGIRRATCPRCGDGFDCGVAASACWCQKLPALDLAHRPADLIGAGCLCASCLDVALAAQHAQRAVAAPLAAATE